MKMKIIVIILIVAGFLIWYLNRNGTSKVISPKSQAESIPQNSQESGPPGGQNIPKEFHFDAGTNLNSELENINPQVLDDDFTDLKNITKSL